MKALLSIIVVAFFSISAIAQDNKKAETKATSTTKSAHECYKMQEGALLHCYGDRTEPVKADVKLKNGTVLTAKGEMTAGDGTKTQLQNGECVTLMGSMGDCEKMHAKGNEPHDNMK